MRPRRPWLAPADAVLQQGAWWGAVLWAARGSFAAATVPAGALVALHLVLSPGERRWVGILALAAALYGLATDGLLSEKGLAAFTGAQGISPAWMVALWGAFGTGLTASLAGLVRWRPAVAALVAAVAGPLSYRAGADLGAVSFPAGAAFALGAVAVQWAVGVAILSQLAKRLETGEAAPAAAEGRAAGAGRWSWAP